MKAVLKLSGVNTFISRRKIIKDVSFQIQSGSIVGLIGPNGAGKTTIMKTILGLTKFNGTIELSGQEVTESNHIALNKIGALIEQPAVYPFMSGKDNLKLYARDKSDMDHVVHILGMDDYITQLAKTYSLGMKQKLGIAIALLNHPALVILDEPMNGLDIESTILVREIIKDYAKSGTAFLISSHVLGELQKIMTHIILIQNGRLIVSKSIAEFNQVRQRQYRLSVNDSGKMQNLLNFNRFTFEPEADVVLIQKDDLLAVESLLLANGITLLEVSPCGLSFEQAVVKLLREQRGVELEN